MNWLRIISITATILSSCIWTDKVSADWIFRKLVADPDQFVVEGTAVYDGDSAIYLGFGQLTRGFYTTEINSEDQSVVVDNTTSIPGSNRRFTDFVSGAVTPFQNGTFVFQGASGNQNKGIYAALLDQNQIVKIADQETQIAGGNPATFDQLSDGTIDGSSIVFTNGHIIIEEEEEKTIIDSIYRTDLTANSFEKIVDPTDAIPGIAVLFEEVKTPAVDGTMVSFIGSGGPAQGIYLHDGSITTAIDNNDTLPGSIENFSTFERIVAFEDDVITFVAKGSSNTEGVYRYDVGSQVLSSVVDDQTQVPGGSGTFNSFSNSGISDKDNQLVFTANDLPNSNGIYIRNSDGVLEKVLVEGNLLNGESFSGADLESGALYDGSFVFSVSQSGNPFEQLFAYIAEEVQSGDINLDDTVNEGDVGELLANYGTTSGALRATGDLDLDGKVTLKDLLILKQNYGNSLPVLSPTTAVAVPEPSTIFLSLLAIGFLFFRKIGLRKLHQ